MATGTLQNLIEDAYLVLDYAARAGRLSDDTLPKALQEADRESAGGNQVAGMLALSKAMSAAVGAIAPITLIDLRAGRSPFDKQHTSAKLLQYCLCIFTVVLAALIGYYSFSVQGKENALREYQDVRNQKIADKINELYMLAQHDEVRTKKDPRYQSYLKNLNEIQTLDARDQTAVSLIVEQSQLSISWPFRGEINDIIARISAAFGVTPRKDFQLPQQTSAFPSSPYEDRCSNGPRVQKPLPAKPAPAVFDTWRDVVTREELNQFCFKEMMGIKYQTSVEQTSLYHSARIRDHVSLLNIWILPFLSGLLGATVFLLRDSISPLTASFGLPRVIARLSLGGVAGIIIGWFWVPSGTVGAEFGKGSSVPMALAFITGFSIDILFSALDRLRGALAAPPQSVGQVQQQK